MAEVGIPYYTKYVGNVQVKVEGYRDRDLDDLYWNNKFAQKRLAKASAKESAK